MQIFILVFQNTLSDLQFAFEVVFSHKIVFCGTARLIGGFKRLQRKQQDYFFSNLDSMTMINPSAQQFQFKTKNTPYINQINT